MAVIRRALIDCRNPVRRHEAEQFFCCEDGRIWVTLAGLDYSKIMLMVEKVGEMPAIDRRNKGRHRQHKKHVWRRHQAA
jgi:hypothetical protein